MMGAPTMIAVPNIPFQMHQVAWDATLGMGGQTARCHGWQQEAPWQQQAPPIMGLTTPLIIDL